MLIHCAVVIALFCFVRRIAGTDSVAFIVAAFFLVHPAATEAINLISFREDLLAGLFTLIAFMLYLKSLRGKEPVRQLCYGASLLVYFGGLLSKEMAATLPLLLMLYDLIFSREWGGRSFFERFARRYAAYFFVLCAYLVLRFVWFRNPHEGVEYLGGGFYTALLTSIRIIAVYIRLMFVPVGLSATYEIVPSVSLLDPRVLFSLAVIVAVVIGAVRAVGRAPLASFAVFSFFLLLLPVANLVPIVNVIAERYLYMPIMMFCLFLATVLMRWRPACRFAVAIVVFYSVVTVVRNADWKSNETIWLCTSRDYPHNAEIHHNLGDVYSRRGDFAKAIEEYDRALAINPRYLAVLVNLADVYDNLGEWDKALRQYEKALTVDPNVPKLHNNLGNMYNKMGKHDEALAEYGKAVALNPYYPDAYSNMGVAYMKKGEMKEAEAAIKKAIEVAPHYAAAKSNLAYLYEMQGEIDAAARVYGVMLRDGMEPARIHYILGDLYMRHGRNRDAIAEYGEALKGEPANNALYFNLGLLHEREGEREEAISYYRRFLAVWSGNESYGDRARASLRRLEAGGTFPEE
jgi:tetratricopeptide (TPR) repeat protein